MLVLLALALPLPQTLAATEAQQAPPRDVSATLEGIRARFDVPALAGMTITLDGPVAAGWCGVRERGSDVPVTPSDRFHIGSCTKAMTATLVALLIEDGTLARELTLAQAWPELADDMDEPWRAVTLDQLLAHTSGAPENLLGYGALGLRMAVGDAPLPVLRRELVAGVTEAPPLFAPGTEQRYSNMGYVIAGALCEERTGKAWEELLQARLLAPLGIESAGFGAPGSTDELDQPRPHGADGKPLPGYDNPPFLGPAGTVHLTLGDWARFVLLHLRGARAAALDPEGAERGTLLLPPRAFAWLHAPRPGTGGTYAAGWATVERPWSKGRVLTHSGSNLAWFACTWVAPAEGLAVLVVCNQGGDPGSRAADAAAWALIQDQLRVAASAGDSPR